MKWILGRAERATLARFARRRLLVALDYDGTLAPIVAIPTRAAMRVRTRRALRRAAACYPCVVISGRSRSDLLRRLRGLGLRQVIGNHGAEPSPRRQQLRAYVRRWRVSLERRIAGLAGVTIEDKGLSLAVHYRRAPNPAQARDSIREAASRLGHARTLGGKCVVNVVPRGAPHKGKALEAERLRLDCEAALYVGDDETDEDVFAHPARGRLGIRVGPSAGSRARYYLRDQAQVDDLLESLVRLREANAPGPASRLKAPPARAARGGEAGTRIQGQRPARRMPRRASRSASARPRATRR
jgi:trehalose 6-phosphate phosphatase